MRRQARLTLSLAWLASVLMQQQLMMVAMHRQVGAQVALSLALGQAAALARVLQVVLRHMQGHDFAPWHLLQPVLGQPRRLLEPYLA